MTREEKQALLARLTADPKREELMQALGEYEDMFDDVFPTYGFPGNAEEMLICARDCVEQGKNVYELGYMIPPSKLGKILY